MAVRNKDQLTDTTWSRINLTSKEIILFFLEVGYTPGNFPLIIKKKRKKTDILDWQWFSKHNKVTDTMAIQEKI